MGVLKFILLYGIEAILISDKTCWRYTDCNYLDAFCKCDWSGGWPPPCSCACNYRGKFVETAVANSVTIKDESFESLCQYESKCDVFERENGDCGKHSACIESRAGVAGCVCEDGFETHTDGCRKIDPCNNYDCSNIENAQCFVNQGAATCVCANNYEPHHNDGSDGIYAERFDHFFENTEPVVCIRTVLCHDEVDCGPNKECHEMRNKDTGLPAAYCLCIDGYTDGADLNDQVILSDADNLVCSNLDECANGNLNMCHRTQDCTDTIGSYTCACKPGYKDNSDTTEDSAPCLVVNFCIAQPHFCAQWGQLCIDDPNDEEGKFECGNCKFGSIPDIAQEECVCDEGLTAIDEHCVHIPEISSCDFEDSVVNCHPEQMAIHLPKCAFTDGELDLSEIHLAGPELLAEPVAPGEHCMPSYDSTGNIISFIIAGGKKVGLKTCNNRKTENATHLLYENSVQYADTEFQGVIFRSKQLKIDFACEFALDVLIGLERPIITISQHLQLELPELDGTITVSINAFEEETFTQPITGSSIIKVPEPIFIKLEIDTASTNFNLQLKKCWATPSANPHDEENYIFIDNYCGDSQEKNDGNLVIMSNGMTHEATFQLASFTFLNQLSDDIYIHCATRLCDSSIDTCNVPCGRKRRSILKFEHEHSNVYTMTSGPIHIINL